MQRLTIFDPAENSRVPYLRGILTRSLQDAGLNFDQSYQVASAVRDELQGQSEVTTEELRARVLDHLAGYDAAVLERYRHPTGATPTILVTGADGRQEPYSRGRSRLSLEPCRFAPEDSLEIAGRLHDELASGGVTEVSLSALRRKTYEKIVERLGEEAGHSYLIWQEFGQSRRRLILLLGGTPGVGKSTLATQVANLLDIVRIQSTDMLREVMRMMMPERLNPVLHTSSFLAWSKLPRVSGHEIDEETALEEGYLQQAQLLSVACQAVMQRAHKERVSLILEGVHLHPMMLSYVPEDPNLIAVPMMLAVLKRGELRDRIRGRGQVATDRRAQRYLKNIDALWRIQSFLLSEADRFGVPIVANDDKDRTRRGVLQTVENALRKVFEGDPEKVLR
jgi:2-phosphoglycerate kinase